MAQQTIDTPVDAPAVGQRIPMTYNEWLLWPESQSRWSEWVDGEAIVAMPPKLVHALLSGFLFRLIGAYVDHFDLGQVIDAPFEMRLPASAREPDILFVKTENLWRLTPERLVGPADLVVELVSDDSVTRDRRDKMQEYTEASIPEYWLLVSRPGKHRADFYGFGEGGAYEPIPLDAEGRFASRVLPGFWLDPTWLWQDPLPKPDAILRTILPTAG